MNNMNIKLNGTFKKTNNKTIRELLISVDMLKEGVVVLLNDEVLKEDEYKSKIKEDDNIELLSFVSGG